MQLYTRPLSPYSAFVRSVLYLKDLSFKPITPPYPLPADFSEITPLKRLPVLITNSGETLFEAAIIAEYIEEHYPHPSLLPGSPRERAVIRLLARLCELEVLGPTLKLFILLSKTEKDTASIEQLFSKLDKGLQIIETRLSDQDFAIGNEPTLADAWLLPVRFLMNPLGRLSGVSDLLNDYPKFDDYSVKAIQLPPLERVWNEMSDGLKDFMPNLA